MLNTFGEYFVILSAVTIIAVMKFLTTPEKPPILNVYRTPSSLYWFKIGVAYLVMCIKDLCETIVTPEENFAKLEQTQKLSSGENATDGVYFNGANTNGVRFSMVINRRNKRVTESYTHIQIGTLRLVHADNPNTFSHSKNSHKFCTKDTIIDTVIPTKKWKICYDGDMKNVTNGTVHHVVLSLDFFTDLPIFNYGTDYDRFLYSKALALEDWNTHFFKLLKEYQLSRYGQFGRLNGKISVDGRDYHLNMHSYRDHTVANTFLWSAYHRYIVHYITVENGDRFVLEKVCQPITLSNFSQGFMFCVAEKQYYPLQNCNMELYQYGEDEQPPLDYAFSFRAGDKQYTVQVKIVTSVPCYLGKDWDSKLLEQSCTADVNGKKAWGSCQWLYRNAYGKSVLSDNL